MRVTDATTVPTSVQRLRWVALGAAALLTAYGEFELMTAIGITPWLAWLAPVGLDVYAYCAFAAGRRADVRAALTLMISCQALAHLLAAGVIPTHWSLVIAVSAVAPVVCWRVHHLAEHDTIHSTTTIEAVLAAPAAADPEDVPLTVEPEAWQPKARQQTRLPEGRRTPAETRKLAAEIMEVQPGITKKDIAAQLGISARRLRTVLAAA